MRLKLTLKRANGTIDDVVVTADATSTIADIAETIARVDPRPVNPVDPQASPERTTLTLQAALPGQVQGTLLPPDAPLADAWIGSGAQVSVVSADSFRSKNGRGADMATLEVVAGPARGERLAVGAGSVILGRDKDVDIVLADPLVSKKHARIEVSDTVDIVDLNSANGIIVDGGQISRVSLGLGQTFTVGDSTLKVINIRTTDVEPAALRPGPVMFNRSPRVEPRYPGQAFDLPEVPTEQPAQPFPFLALIAPIIVGIVMFSITKSAMTVAFVALSPLLMAGTWFTARSTRKRALKLATEKFEAQISTLDATLNAETILERDRRLSEAPSTEEIVEQALALGPGLWTRRPEHWTFLALRLGIGSAPSRNSFGESNRSTGLPDFVERVDAFIERHRVIDGVPLVENLVDSGAIGIAGPAGDAIPVAHSMLAQLTGLYSPSEVALAAIVGSSWSKEFEWLKWIPHTSSAHSPLGAGIHLADSAAAGAAVLAGLEELISSRTGKNAERRGAVSVSESALTRGTKIGQEGGGDADPAAETPIPSLVVFITDDAPVERARLVQFAERAADAGILPIWVSSSVAELPAICRTWADVSNGADDGTLGYVRLGEQTNHVAFSRLDAAKALEFARRLAPVIDAGALVADDSDLPRSVSMLSILGSDLSESSDAVIDRWRQNDSITNRTPGAPHKARRAGKLRALVGQSALDAMHLDLRTQGPHALVGGTTGSGKSEFLQAWVLGMAAEYSPDRVTFLFVDYKGGSAFADCVKLPHTVGLVTDLSQHLVRRALTSLRAELHFREHLFNRKKVKDLIELEKRGDPECPPSLVLVIDEFAALVGEVPEFVDGVVDIAQRGRSLGIHLIMATQRPAGVIRDNLRANTNLRIALRMADESDSVDVVGTPVAGEFDPSIPGRGIAKTGPGRLTAFQSAYSGGWTSTESARPVVSITELRFGAASPWEEPETDNVESTDELGPNDQKRLVQTFAAASAAAKIPAPRRPWLDDLATTYDLSKLYQRTDQKLVLGVSDLPERQSQDPVYYQPDSDGHLAIYGTGGTGKSTALRTLAVAAGITPRGGPVDVYGLDFGTGSLRMLEVLPHVGSIIPGDDGDRVIRLMRKLKDELDTRGSRFAEANAGSISEYRSLSGDMSLPRIVVLLDNYPAFRQEFEGVTGRTVWYNVFLQVLSEGRQLGVHFVFTADRSGSVPTAVASSVQRKVILRMADDNAYALFDVPNDILSSSSPVGRAIVDGAETQIAVLGGSSSVADQSLALAKFGKAMEDAGRAKVEPIGALPTAVSETEMPKNVDGYPVLGISDEALLPIGFEPVGTLVVGGPPASGRSNALRYLLGSVERATKGATFHYFGNRRSELGRDKRFATASTSVEQAVENAREITAQITENPDGAKVVIFIESLSEFMSGPADSVLVELIKQVKRTEHLLIADSDISTWGSSWPLMGEVKSSRRGLLLQPDSLEAETILKTPVARANRSEFPPGRGLYVIGGKATRVQIPLADSGK
jgi:DNA segregation ATPase FtsK/SpoIIIE, S-DNA-T family